MKIRNKAPSFLLITIALFSSAPTFAIDETEYVETVMDMLRTQILLLKELASSPRFKYSDNMVRNANAIGRTFGLLGPMEWHAVESASIRSEFKGTSADLDEKMFHELARASHKSMKNVMRVAHDVMENEDRSSLITAIDEMQQSCDNCHMLLPKSVAPDLWGPLPRK